MLSVTTRTAPRNVRMMASFFGNPDKAHAARAALSEAVLDQADQPTPEAPPNTTPSADARLDQQSAQLADHETRLVAIEKRMPEPGFGEGDGETPAEASAVAARPAMIQSREIYAKMNSRQAGLKAAAPATTLPEQTRPDQVLQSRAIYSRLNSHANQSR